MPMRNSIRFAPGYLRVLVSHAAPEFDGSRCIDSTGKFDQRTIASGLDDAAAMFGECGVVVGGQSLSDRPSSNSVSWSSLCAAALFRLDFAHRTHWGCRKLALPRSGRVSRLLLHWHPFASSRPRGPR